MQAFQSGDRVRLIHDVDRYPHFIAPAGATGTVVDHGDPSIALAVRLDEILEGAEEWENEVHWLDYDPCEDVVALLEPHQRVLLGNAGYGVMDVASGRFLSDACESVAEAIAAASETRCVSCGHLVELDEDGLCDSCEQDKQYERVSAGPVVELSLEDAEFVAENLEFLAGVDEGENTDFVRLQRLAGEIRGKLEVRS